MLDVLTMKDYCALSSEDQDRVHAWVVEHEVDYTTCTGYWIDGDNVVFSVNLRNEAGNFYLGDDREVARTTLTRPLQSPPPV